MNRFLRLPSTALALDGVTFLSYVLPVAVCYLVSASLVVRPGTRSLRISLWPLTAMLSLRAAVSIDLSIDRPESGFRNIMFKLVMFCITERTLEWTLPREPFKRHCRPKDSTPSILLDALDLAGNARGIGWDWSKGLYVPPQTRPRFTQTAFAFFTLFSVVVHAFLGGVFHVAILSFSPDTFGTPTGGTIFDDTLSPTTRYLRSSVIATLTASWIYCVLQMVYDLSTLGGMLILRQDPDQWPPSFEAPWFATSVGDFWGRRWHQWLRRTFLFLGGYPLSFIFGRIGGIFGAFFASAIFHHIALFSLPGQKESSYMLLSFGMMAFGVVAERMFTQVTGRKVGGLVGWVWTMAWMISWGNVMVDGWARAGALGSWTSAVEGLPFVRAFVNRLVVSFDSFLHGAH